MLRNHRLMISELNFIKNMFSRRISEFTEKVLSTERLEFCFERERKSLKYRQQQTKMITLVGVLVFLLRQRKFAERINLLN